MKKKHSSSITLFIFQFFSLAFGFHAQAAINPAGVAVVIIDMQGRYFSQAEQNEENDKKLNLLMNNQVDLLHWAIQKNVPILFFEYVNQGPTTSKLLSVLDPDSTLGAPIPYKSKIVIKYGNDGFQRSSEKITLETLNDWKTHTLIVSGINGGSCVIETAVGAIGHGFKVITSLDLVADLNHGPVIFPYSWENFVLPKNFTVYSKLKKIIH